MPRPTVCSRAALLLLAASVLLLPACQEDPVAPVQEPDLELFDKSIEIVFQSGNLPPPEQTTVAMGPESVSFWPYTGLAYDGTPVDPINLVFAGHADVLQIRAALLALDGDRTAFGFPDAPPFNQRWLDALGGDIQTTCAVDGHGWVGSVVQLTLGDYGPLRFHLRLFRTGRACGAGCWTLGGAHFELQVPGTTEHQPLSWERAEEMVIADFLRSGLLDPDVPLLPTGVINAAPSYRAIPAMIYNLLPPDLIGYIGGPPQPVTDDVPLASDGQGTILNLALPATVVPEVFTSTTTIMFDQLVPRPFCSQGPGDWLMITGPVDFTLNAAVTDDLRYRARADYLGQLMVQPFDLSGGDPVPVGEPFPARVTGSQQVQLADGNSRVLMLDHRMTREADGPQVLTTRLEVPQHGLKTYYSQVRCLDDPGLARRARK